ncbi:calcyclin-binding protein-like [Cherax quadricarinatus]|uniref:calcyclin-binding protein-like n=1 Tax=Cherax quadricarinatus TaxID=27406 RepID=UPI00387ECE87
MSNKLEEVLKDVEELRTLVASATRKRIQDILSQELRKLEIEFMIFFFFIYICRSVQVLVQELDGKNYQLNITNLAKNIKPDASYHKVKTDMLVLFLCKSEQQKWAGVTAEDVRASEARKPKVNSDDPNAGMMDLMKQMYDEGDDKMKQMLNKTWYESQQKTLKGGNDLENLDL